MNIYQQTSAAFCSFTNGDYERGYQDGQRAREYDNARRDYERGFRDGYGGGLPLMPYMPLPPYSPTLVASRFAVSQPSLACTAN